MNISLTPELERIVQEKVHSGMYHSASEVVREALRLMQERDTLQKIKLQELRQAVQVGIEQADRGETALLDIKEVETAGKKRVATRQKAT